jgi:hypothetical protein
MIVSGMQLICLCHDFHIKFMPDSLCAHNSGIEICLPFCLLGDQSLHFQRQRRLLYVV